MLNQELQIDSLGRLAQNFEELPAQALDLHVGVDDEVVGVVEFEDVGDEVHVVVLDVDFEIEEGREAVLLLVDPVDLLELAYGAPSARSGPIRKNVLVLNGHELRHEVVDADPNNLVGGEAKHVLDIPRGRRNDTHGLGIDQGLDDAGSLMVDELLELLQGVELVLFVPEVELL